MANLLLIVDCQFVINNCKEITPEHVFYNLNNVILVSIPKSKTFNISNVLSISCK